MKRLFLIACVFFCIPVFLSAQVLHNDVQGQEKARVIEVLVSEERDVPGTDVTAPYQELRAEVLSGDIAGRVVVVKNDLILLEAGDTFYLNYLITIDGVEIFTVADPYRVNTLVLLSVLFAVVVIVFGRLGGLRSLLSLALSFAVIVYLLLPAILKGFSPVIATVFFALLILALAMYITHGWNRITHAALLGTGATIVVVSVIATWAVNAARLTGFASDEALYLNLNTGGTLDMSGLLLGAMIIGVLGILDDIAITQASAVAEFYKSLPDISWREAYRKAIVIGRHHVGALVNTLALAYAGASLPLLLLFYGGSAPVASVINREIFATEIIRTVVGSVGLVLAVPFTTIIAVFLLEKYRGAKEEIHSHSHGHLHS